MELGKPPFGIGPEGFNAVDMSSAVCKFILSMVDTIMLFVAQVNQTAVAAPVIRVDDAVGIHPTADNGQQRPSGAIRDDLGIDTAASLEDPKHGGLARGIPAPFPFDAPDAEEGFVDFDLAFKRRGAFAKFGEPLSDQVQVSVNRVSV